jgi:hypothetical protein
MAHYVSSCNDERILINVFIDVNSDETLQSLLDRTNDTTYSFVIRTGLTVGRNVTTVRQKPSHVSN